MIDVEQLIKEVRRRPAVWNQKCHEYHNRERAIQMWKEIGRALGVKNEIAKLKWKHLRDNFRTELKKSLVKGNNGELLYQSSWLWFGPLSFLKEVVIPQRTREFLGIDLSDLPSKSHEESEVQSENSDIPKKFHKDTMAPTTQVHVIPIDANRQPRKKTQNFDEELMNLERKKYLFMINQVEQDKQDDIYHFLMSLMTPLKSLSLDRQMLARMKLQEIVVQEIIQSQHLTGIHNENSPPYKPNFYHEPISNVNTKEIIL